MNHALMGLALLAGSAPALAVAQSEAPDLAATETGANTESETSDDVEVIADASTEQTLAMEARDRSLKFSGYLRPGFSYLRRNQGLPRDKWVAGADASQVGFIVSGSPVEQVSFLVHVFLDINRVRAVTGVNSVSVNGSGVDRIEANTTSVLGSVIQEATARYQPFDNVGLRFGRMLIPFTVEASRANTALLFPGRAPPTQVFLAGADVGILLELGNKDGILNGSVGVFNGEPVQKATSDERGLLYTARVDFNPFGDVPDGVDMEHLGFRAGFGAGGTYYPRTQFDSAGFVSTRSDDLRLTASIRASFRGAFLQAEALRSEVSDDVTDQLQTAWGAYGLLSYFVEIDERWGLAPVIRFGGVNDSPGIGARKTQWLESGAAIYLGDEENRDRSRLTANYVYENRQSEGERAHGVNLLYQVTF